MIKAWSIRLCKGLSIKVLKQITTTILEMYERLVNSKWGSMFKVKAQTQVAQLYSTLTLSLIWIGNMISSKWKTRWGCTHPKQHKSYRPSRKLCMARIMKPRRFKTLRKRQKSRLKGSQKTMKVISLVKAQRTQMELLYSILEWCQTWTSVTKTSTRRLWWNLTRPKLPRFLRRSNRFGKARTMTPTWLIRHKINQKNRVTVLSTTNCLKLKHQSLAHPSIASPSIRATTTASWLEQTLQRKTWTLQRCKWLLHKRNLSLAPCSIQISLPKQDRTICQRSRPSNVIHPEMKRLVARHNMSTRPWMGRYKWVPRQSMTRSSSETKYVRLARRSKQ